MRNADGCITFPVPRPEGSEVETPGPRSFGQPAGTRSTRAGSAGKLRLRSERPRRAVQIAALRGVHRHLDARVAEAERRHALAADHPQFVASRNARSPIAHSWVSRST